MKKVVLTLLKIAGIVLLVLIVFNQVASPILMLNDLHMSKVTVQNL